LRLLGLTEASPGTTATHRSKSPAGFGIPWRNWLRRHRGLADSLLYLAPRACGNSFRLSPKQIGLFGDAPELPALRPVMPPKASACLRRSRKYRPKDDSACPPRRHGVLWKIVDDHHCGPGGGPTCPMPGARDRGNCRRPFFAGSRVLTPIASGPASGRAAPFCAVGAAGARKPMAADPRDLRSRRQPPKRRPIIYTRLSRTKTWSVRQRNVFHPRTLPPLPGPALLIPGSRCCCSQPAASDADGIRGCTCAGARRRLGAPSTAA